MTRPYQTCIALVMVVLFGAGIVGCASKTTSVGLTPQELGKIGAQIQNNPQMANQILASHDLTGKEFKRAIREVSSDAEMAQRYRRSFERHLR